MALTSLYPVLLYSNACWLHLRMIYKPPLHVKLGATSSICENYSHRCTPHNTQLAINPAQLLHKTTKFSIIITRSSSSVKIPPSNPSVFHPVQYPLGFFETAKYSHSNPYLVWIWCTGRSRGRKKNQKLICGMGKPPPSLPSSNFTKWPFNYSTRFSSQKPKNKTKKSRSHL